MDRSGYRMNAGMDNIGSYRERAEDNQLFTHQKQDLELEKEDIDDKEKYAKEIFFPDIKLYEIMRYGGSYLPFDKEKLSYFYVVISGHIQSGTFDGYDGLCCSYSIETGQDWAIDSVSKS